MQAKFNGSLQFSVQDWSAWSPGRLGKSAWRNWAIGAPVEPAAAPEPTAKLPMQLKRRATRIGQKALEMALAIPDADAAKMVVASRHGEYDHTVAILSSLADREPVSPAEFSMSVHHGLAGLLSIHTGNRLGHVAVAAGIDTFCNGLIEAALCLAETPEIPVLLIYYDAPLPEAYAPFQDESEAALPLAAAFLLRPCAETGLALHYHRSQAPERARENQALAFLRLLLSDAADAECQGEHMIWRWSRVH
ncbi:beta-ketoacyl synthase chain length factor [Dongia sp.]|uniref:beta-ketoacyl synthase chain length factor n=1 Tax=Dongia sp. TaxID=1977262 RepID=UPI0035B2D693